MRRDSSAIEPVKIGGGAGFAGCSGGSGSELCPVLTGCFEGLTSQASSSKLAVVLFFLGGGGAAAKGVNAESDGDAIFFSLLFGFKLSASTTSLLWIGGAGRPFRVLLRRAPPGPEKRPPPSLGDRGASPSSVSPLLLTFRSFDLLRLNFVSRYFMTRKISPSLRPNVRNTEAFISGNIVSSIKSLWKLNAYRSQLYGLTPVFRKKSNQSYFSGPLG